MTEMLLVDTHVHIRTCFPRDRYFDVAWNNFYRAAADLGHGPATGALMLTESATEDEFRSLRRAAGAPLEAWGGWSAQRTEDDCSLVLERGERRLLLIAGRQVDTSERLEVSVLGTPDPIPDHTPVEAVLDTARERNGVAVIPWAPGKWWLARGRLLHRLIDRRPQDGFFLGDNGGRPWLWPTPRHIRRARKLGIPVLPGSDPLPFVSEMMRTGTFGIAIRSRLDDRTPGEGLKKLLRDPAGKFTSYGHLANPVSFLWRESVMQMTKRRRKAMAPVRG